jgi:hypothetical protein
LQISEENNASLEEQINILSSKLQDNR